MALVFLVSKIDRVSTFYVGALVYIFIVQNASHLKPPIESTSFKLNVSINLKKNDWHFVILKSVLNGLFLSSMLKKISPRRSCNFQQGKLIFLSLRKCFQLL